MADLSKITSVVLLTTALTTWVNANSDEKINNISNLLNQKKHTRINLYLTTQFLSTKF